MPRLSRRRLVALSAVGPSLSAAGPDCAWPSPLGSAHGLAAHLLRRAGFGYTDAELDAAASMRYSDLVEKVTAQQPEDLPAIANPSSYRDVITAWQSHMATTGSQYPVASPSSGMAS